MPVFIAIDLGAGSGRVIAAHTDLQTLSLEEIHRFDNPGTDVPGGSHWNVIGLHREILSGLRIAAARFGQDIAAVGIDTWGCDHALLDRRGRLLGLPHQYRDPRHEGMPAKMHALMPEEEIYSHTGITTNFYNSSLHLLAEKLDASPALDVASHLLFIPDLLSYWLCGRMAVERTVASTSQLIDPATGDWAWPVIDALGLPRPIFGEIVAPGTLLAPLTETVCRETGMPPVPVIASCSHDTASAVAGIPMSGDDRLWLSSGTWSIMGLEISAPIRHADAFALRCCNELGAEGSVRFLRNISGLWMIQECRRHWASAGEDLSYAALADLATKAEGFTAFVDPDSPEFAAPGDMPLKIQEWCRRTGQKVPEDKGSILRVVTESLAMKYRVVRDSLCQVAGREFSTLHAGGGGIQNTLLSQATADALGVRIIAGPVEATSCGNAITQMIATGHLADLDAGRALIQRSFEFQTFEPNPDSGFADAFPRFLAIIGA